MTRSCKVLFLGSKSLGLRVLSEMRHLAPEALLGAVTIDDAADTRSMVSEFESFTSRNGVPLFVAKDRQDSENLIARLKPDLCLVSGWYWIISEKCLETVPYGFLGFHASLLPKRRGWAPLVWAMIDGETETGVSLMRMVSEADSGDILAQKRIPIGSSNYISHVLLKVEDATLAILREQYLNILNGCIGEVPQNHAEATYCAQRIPSDGLINWHWTSKQIYDFVRAQSEPYPGAFTFLNGQKLTVWRSRPVDMAYRGTVGQVACVRSNGVYVICGDQKPLLLEQVQLEGELRRPAREVLRSTQLRFFPMTSHG